MRNAARAGLVTVLVAVGLILAVDTAPASLSGAAGEEHEGEIFSFGITVPSDPIEVGDTIVFPNVSDRPHTITDRGSTFDTGEIAPGTTDSVTFDTPGNFEIFCQINPSTMNALVVVEPGSSPPAAARVQLYDEFREGQTRRFDPPEITVDEGTEITVANVGGLEHTLTADDGSFSTGTIEPGAEQGRFAGDSATLVADEAGEFAFHCDIHPDEMQGVLRVEGEDPPETTTTTGGDEDERAPPDEAGDDAAAAAADGGDDGRDIGATAAAVGIVLLGLAAIVVAVAATGGRRQPDVQAF
jgi:plastocyanin